MADAHAHGGVGRLGEALDARRADSRRRMLVALAINAVLLGATFVGALLTGSLALLADTGHLLSDVGAIVLGVVGLGGNVAATWVLARGEREDLNLEGVLRHSAADALGSLGVIVSGGVILTTGWAPIDPLASLAIAALILASSVRLIAGPVNVLMEAAPEGMDAERIAREMTDVEHVRAVHDLHVWTVTAGFETLVAHVVVAGGVD